MGNFYMESTQINYRRDEKLKTVDQKLQELSETSAIDTDIAPVFKSTNTYQPGDMVYYRNKLYVFNVEHTGAWAAADVTATDVTTTMNAGLDSLKSGLTNNTNDLTTGSRTKNILPLSIDFIKANNTEGTWNGNVYTVNGITITFNTDSNGNITSITKSADTPSATTVLLLYKSLSTFLPSATTKLNGCPTGGGNQTYKIDVIDSNAAIYAVDYGASTDGVTISDTSLVYDLMVRIVIYTGSTTEITFYPMIRLATASATYVPYIESVNARLEAVENGIARLVCTEIVYDDSASLFTLPSGVPKPKDGAQIMVCGRNRSTGAIYALWFDNSASGFKIGKILDGNAPADGISISVQYIA